MKLFRWRQGDTILNLFPLPFSFAETPEITRSEERDVLKCRTHFGNEMLSSFEINKDRKLFEK